MNNETDLTKLARWLIPGWMCIFSYFGFVIIDIFFSRFEQFRMFSSVGDMLVILPEANEILTALLIAAAGIPLGFSIYQAYFFLRWNSPFSRDGLLPPLLPGRWGDLDQITLGLSNEDLSLDMPWRKDWIKNPLFAWDHGYRWRYIELLFTEAAQKLDSKFKGLSIYSRHRYLHEVTHVLGASIGAIYIGFVGYVLTKSLREDVNLASYILVVIFGLYILMYFLHKEFVSKTPRSTSELETLEASNEPVPAIQFRLLRRGRLSNVSLISIVSPGSLFLFGLTVIHFLANPLLNPVSYSSWAGLSKLVTVILGMLIWTRSKKKPKPDVLKGDVLSMVFILIIAIIISLYQINHPSAIEWSFLTTTFVFLVFNLVLFQNRQNSKDDMLALENYTLRRHLTNKQCE